MDSQIENEAMRLDVWLVKTGHFRSRDRANEAVKGGQVSVNGKVVIKPSFLIGPNDKCLVLEGDFHFVGRGALKLKSLVEEWRIDLKDKVCLDVGVATGGFSDFMLQSGAKKVYGVDVGDGQIAPELLEKPNFVFRNHTDAIGLEKSDFEETLDLIVVDVSFVSITRFFPAFTRLADDKALMLLLIKPQFEMNKVTSTGLNNKYLVAKILKNIENSLPEFDLQLMKSTPCAVKGKEGNQEYWWMVKYAPDAATKIAARRESPEAVN